MGAPLVKTRSVLHLHRGVPPAGPVGYTSADPDDPDDARSHELWLDRAVFVDMGEPQQITVTIRPGDELNPPPESNQGGN